MRPSVSELELSQCDREPIHLLGGIQAYGVLLAFRGPDRLLEVVSANIQALLGRPPEALLGKPAAQVLPAELWAQWELLAARGALRVALPSGPYRALLHESDGLSVLELEPAEPQPDMEETALELVRRLVSPLAGAKGTRELLQTAANTVRALTGFDRVMVYRFDADWHGEVLAESKREGMDGFLGMHFPATDIPVQARALYTRNPLRLIADARARPVPLVPPVVPALGRPLDLSGSALRSVSPIHLEYLRNMGVEASFSLSLLKDGALWGLIACHHLAPLHLSYERRRACEVLTQLLALQLASEERAAEAAENAHRAALLGPLATSLGEGGTLDAALEKEGARVLELTGATGAALLLGGEPLLVGRTPSMDEVEALVAWLAPQPFQTSFHTERLGALYPPLAARADVASGLLAVRLAPASSRLALWFRPEVVRTISWAGNPRKPAEPEPGHARLHPRGSFQAWEETVQETSLAWKRADLAAAEGFRSALIGVVLRQAAELERLSEALSRSNAELDAFGHTVAHDLKEPLRGIQQYAGFVMEDYSGVLGPEGRGHMESLLWLAQRSGDMLDGLFEYSRMGRVDLAWGEVDMQEVVDEVLTTLSARFKDDQVTVRLPRRLPTVQCDGVRIAQVWANLLVNAAKYQEGAERWVEAGFYGPGEPRPGAAGRYPSAYVFYVKDPGIGIAAQFHEVIFEMFRRLHSAKAYGGGTGVGLAIARRLVQLHGGALWVDSAPKQGAAFYFTLGRGPG
ncbi:ATP-binding protein [Stigmatella erecta]|uniref:histidine kinase n=1 Tax=Stigmatella erecta TaxID=83460 RepID=A0A1I0KNV6_9BACT|nr:ATP-binding protein [Stigmatella erecta]SEU26965.1 Bacteriophytochrome (light-regulated signal transduction histidine kinase) [Stigmatella erecta]